MPPFFCFTITLSRTLLLRLKISSVHLSGNKWTTPLYSPDLAPSDYHLFLYLKKILGGKRFDDNEDLKDAAQKWLTSQVGPFYEEDIQKLVPCYNKCLNNGGEYVEKYLKNVESDNNKILYKTLLNFFTAKRYLLSE